MTARAPESTPLELPLSDAARRLRRRPGRPRKLEYGHIAGTPDMEVRTNKGAAAGAMVSQASALVPRLLDLQGAAIYLSVSDWTVRDLVAAGTLSRVRIPLANQGELRKLLFDRADLDGLIERWKDGSREGPRPHGPEAVTGSR